LVAVQVECHEQDSTTPYPLQLGGELVGRFAQKVKKDKIMHLQNWDFMQAETGHPSKFPSKLEGLGVVDTVEPNPLCPLWFISVPMWLK